MSVISLANDLVGKVKYSFGANSITSAGGTGDCSSFVQYVSEQNGVNLPRTAESQYNSSKGKAVSKDQLQVGDVVFFQGTYKSGISHVGIYAGNGKFIHNSSSKGGTTISDLSDSYYTQHYAGARRYEGANTGFSGESIVSIARSMKGKVTYDYEHKNKITNVVGNLVADCGGFVAYVLSKVGIKTGTSLKSLINDSRGVDVSKDDLQAGDIIFYKDVGGSGLTHVNIYAGNGKVIESTKSAKGYKETNFSGFYENHFYKAKRFISASTDSNETQQNTSSNLGLIKGFASNIIVALVIAVLLVLGFLLFAKAFV